MTEEELRRDAGIALRIVGAGPLARMLEGGSEGPDPVVPEDLHLAQALRSNAAGEVQCSACASWVAFADILVTQNEHLCSGCRAARRQPVEALPVDGVKLRSKMWIVWLCLVLALVGVFALVINNRG